jgi:hypothetical protein
LLRIAVDGMIRVEHRRHVLYLKVFTHLVRQQIETGSGVPSMPAEGER